MFDRQSLKNIQMIVSDIDGTLLNDNGFTGTESKKLIRALMYHNVSVSLATGRLYSAAEKLAEELSLNGHIISLDGAEIKDFKNGKTIFESYLKTKDVQKAIAISENLLVNIVLCHSSMIYYTERNSLIPSLLNKYGAVYKQVSSYDDYLDGTLEIVCAGDRKSSVKKMEERFNLPYSFGYNTSFFRSHTKENIYYLEIRKAGSSKGKAFEKLLKQLSIKPYQAAVIGDWYNDIPMFHTKAVKVAVANAIPELINRADIVTKRSNNDDGTAEFFEMVLKAKRNGK